jgi:hypothetical protein
MPGNVIFGAGEQRLALVNGRRTNGHLWGHHMTLAGTALASLGYSKEIDATRYFGDRNNLVRA